MEIHLRIYKQYDVMETIDSKTVITDQVINEHIKRYTNERADNLTMNEMAAKMK